MLEAAVLTIGVVYLIGDAVRRHRLHAAEPAHLRAGGDK